MVKFLPVTALRHSQRSKAPSLTFNECSRIDPSFTERLEYLDKEVAMPFQVVGRLAVKKDQRKKGRVMVEKGQTRLVL